MTEKKQKDSNKTASFDDLYFCRDCNWPVVFACVNDEFNDYEPAKGWDWFLYCSNKGCKNHGGEGLWQDELDWVYTGKRYR